MLPWTHYYTLPTKLQHAGDSVIDLGRTSVPSVPIKKILTSVISTLPKTTNVRMECDNIIKNDTFKNGLTCPELTGSSSPAPSLDQLLRKQQEVFLGKYPKRTNDMQNTPFDPYYEIPEPGKPTTSKAHLISANRYDPKKKQYPQMMPKCYPYSVYNLRPKK